jgi:hypothetical protein
LPPPPGGGGGGGRHVSNMAPDMRAGLSAILNFAGAAAPCPPGKE